MVTLQPILESSGFIFRNLNHPKAAGSDRFLRLIQSLARLLAWNISKLDPYQHSQSIQEFLLKLARQISLTSKLTRTLKIPEFLLTAARATKNEKKATGVILSYLTVAKMLSLVAFSILDFACYLNFANIKSFLKAERLQRRAYQAWLFSITCGLVSTFCDIARLLKIQRDSPTADNKLDLPSLSNYNRHRYALRNRLCIDLCDFTAATSVLHYHSLNQGIVSLVGCVGNVVTMYSNPL